MKESGLAVQPARDTSVQKGASTDPIERMNSLYNLIARRAYEIFVDDGRLDGHDLDDWLQAEEEFLHPLHLEISDSPAALTVRAEVPGFKVTDLQINVEPRRVTITGTRETKQESKTEETVYSETCSDQILRAFDLPAAVDPAKVKATLKDGILKLDMPKATLVGTTKADSKAVIVEPQAA